MSIRGIERVSQRYRVAVDGIAVDNTERALYMILSSGGAAAATMTPIDTSNLINSQYAPRIVHNANGSTGSIGYTAAYAAAVHQASGKLKGEPRQHFGRTKSGTAFGGGTGVGRYWDPNAEPGFLRKGFDMIRPSIPNILRVAYRVG